MASNTTLELHKSEETRTNNNMQVELRNESEGQDSSSPPNSRKRRMLSLTPSEAEGVRVSASPTLAKYRGSFKLRFLGSGSTHKDEGRGEKSASPNTDAEGVVLAV